MSDSIEDTRRALAAAKAIVDGRDPRNPRNTSAIFVTLEHAIATVILSLMHDPKMAALMLNEALVPGIEARLMMVQEKRSLG